MSPNAKRVAVPSTYQLSFNTDYGACQAKVGCGLLGPDGPWQAPIIEVGDRDGLQLPLYPSISYGSTILTTEDGGLYDPSKSSTAHKRPDDYSMQDDVTLDNFINQTSGTMASYFDSLTLTGPSPDTLTVNTTLFAATDWKYRTANGSSYSPLVGYLGLGTDSSSYTAPKGPPGLLEQAKSNGIIGTRTFSMHLASAKLQQSGSFILGGYDTSRALGPLAAWTIDSPAITLKDVTLGVEEGGSPFRNRTLVTKDLPLSIWQGLGGNKLGINATRLAGGAGTERQPTVDIPATGKL